MGEVRSLELDDIHDASICDLKGIPVTFTNRSTRVYFLVPADQHTFRVLAELRENPLVPALDLIRSLKRMRARMLEYRSQITEEENGESHKGGRRNGNGHRIE